MTTILLSLVFTLLSSINASPMQLASPILLGTSLNNNTNLSVFNSTTLQIGPENCFEPKPGRIVTNYRDCEQAAIQFNPESIVAQLIFSRGPSAQYKLPRSFRAGTCVMYLDMPFDEDYDTLTLPDIALVAGKLAMECTAQGSSNAFGGIAAVGPKKLLHVEFFGRVDPGANADEA